MIVKKNLYTASSIFQAMKSAASLFCSAAEMFDDFPIVILSVSQRLDHSEDALGRREARGP